VVYAGKPETAKTHVNREGSAARLPGISHCRLHKLQAEPGLRAYALQAQIAMQTQGE
jgi:hypothetical protein